MQRKNLSKNEDSLSGEQIISSEGTQANDAAAVVLELFGSMVEGERNKVMLLQLGVVFQVGTLNT